MTERVLIPFSGEGSGRAGLSWGQRGVWRSIVLDGEAKVIGGVVEVPGGSTVERVADSMRFVIGRHQSLRTTLHFGPDGEVGQLVHASGEVPLEVVDAGPGEDPAVVAAALADRFKRTPFDYEHDWPVRLGAVRGQDGRVSHTVAVYLHTTMDALGLSALVADLVAYRTGKEVRPVTDIQPLELARREAGPAAQRQSRAALKHMETVLRATPAGAWPGTGLETDEHDTVYYWSPRLSVATAAVAARLGVDSSAILLGAYGLSLNRVAGVNPVAVQLAVSNRFRPRMGGTVAPMAQVAPCLLDTTGTTPAGVVGRAWRASLGAYKHAYYDPAGRAELVARLTEEEGDQVDLFVFFNDRRVAGPPPVAPRMDGTAEPELPRPAAPRELDRAELVAALAATRDRSTVRWNLLAGFMREALYLDVDEVDGALELTLTVDLRILSRADAEQVLRGMEDAVVEMALEPSPVPVPEPAAVP